MAFDFSPRKKISLILSLSFISIVFATKNEGEQCRSSQECNQGLTCIQQPMIVKGAVGNIDANPGICLVQSRLLTPTSVSTTNSGQSQLLAVFPAPTAQR